MLRISLYHNIFISTCTSHTQTQAIYCILQINKQIKCFRRTWAFYCVCCVHADRSCVTFWPQINRAPPHYTLYGPATLYSTSIWKYCPLNKQCINPCIWVGRVNASCIDLLNIRVWWQFVAACSGQAWKYGKMSA